MNLSGYSPVSPKYKNHLFCGTSPISAQPEGMAARLTFLADAVRNTTLFFQFTQRKLFEIAKPVVGVVERGGMP